MPSSANYKRNYKQEYANETRKRRDERALRNRARRILEKSLGRKLGKGIDADHRVPLDKGGKALDPSNLRPLKARNNRSFKRNSKGGMK